MTTGTMPLLSERQKREQDFYNQYAKKFDATRGVDMAPIHGPLKGTEKRPWNSYWATYEFAIKNFKTGDKLLDFGSGPGENALRFSEIGYKVEGFDISEANIELANKLFSKNKRSDRGSFQVSPAEALPYADNSFETIVGIDILHHVNIQTAIKECRRVLKKGGVAIFREPLEVPFLDWIRRTKLVKMFAPTEASFELHITEDERKLNSTDVEILRSEFPNMEMKKFLFLSRFDKFFRKGEDPRPSLLERIDHLLMNYIPGVKYLGGAVIFVLKK